MENNHQIAQITSPYAPGYRFMPTDQELITEYLAKKVNNDPIPIPDICEVNLYEHCPFSLAANYPQLGDNERYFFTPRDRKYPNGSRPNRAVGAVGYWKATGADKAIKTKGGEVIGGKKVLVFYVGKPKSEMGTKTDWIMHEYRLNAPSKSPGGKDMRLDDWVLCRIYRKSDRSNKKQKGCEKVNKIVALDDDNNENAIDQQNQDGGAMMIDGGHNHEYQQIQPNYFQEGYNQAIPNFNCNPLMLLGTGTPEDHHGINFSDQNLNFDCGASLFYEQPYQELAWGGFSGLLENHGTNNNDAFNFQQQYPYAPDVDLKKIADDFVRNEKAGFANDDAERKNSYS